SGRRLVDHEQLRRMNQRLGDAEAPSHAAGVGAGRAIRSLLQADGVDEQPRAVHQVLDACEMADRPELLRQIADGAADGRARAAARRIETVVAPRARRRLDAEDENGKERRLAGAVRAEEAEE